MCQLFSVSGEAVHLLRLRNHWGQCEWNRISVEDARLLGLQVQDGGEFWMIMEDFLDNCQNLEVCHQKSENLYVQEFHGNIFNFYFYFYFHFLFQKQ